MKIAVIQKAKRKGFKRPNQSDWFLYNLGEPLCSATETYNNVTDCLAGLQSSLGEITSVPSETEDYTLSAARSYRTARGTKTRTFLGFIVRPDGDNIAVFDEVRGT